VSTGDQLPIVSRRAIIAVPRPIEPPPRRAGHNPSIVR